MADFMSLSDLENQNTHEVWVLNKTNPRGLLSFIVDSNGRRVTVTMPLTWIPFDLSTRITKKSLIENPQFRRMVTSGMLQIVTPDYAAKALSTPEARTEMSKVFGSEGVITYTDPNLPPDIKAGVESAGVSGFVLSLATNKDLVFSEAVSDIRRRSDALPQSDLKYLSENAINTDLRNWAAQQLGV